MLQLPFWFDKVIGITCWKKWKSGIFNSEKNKMIFFGNFILCEDFYFFNVLQAHGHYGVMSQRLTFPTTKEVLFPRNGTLSLLPSVLVSCIPFFTSNLSCSAIEFLYFAPYVLKFLLSSLSLTSNYRIQCVLLLNFWVFILPFSKRKHRSDHSAIHLDKI